jgi:hypothetical protein
MCLGPWGILPPVVLPLREGVTPVGDLKNFCFRGEGVIVKLEHSSSFPFRNVSVPRRARYLAVSGLGTFNTSEEVVCAHHVVRLIANFTCT